MNASVTKKLQAAILPHAVYLFSKIEDQITAYANQISAPPAELADRVVDLIASSPTLRLGMGSAHSVLQMQLPSPKRLSTRGETEVDEVPRGIVQGVRKRSRMTAAGRRAIKIAQRARWAKHNAAKAETEKREKKAAKGRSWKERFGEPHWTQTAAGKKKLAKMNKHRQKNGKMGSLHIIGRKAA